MMLFCHADIAADALHAPRFIELIYFGETLFWWPSFSLFSSCTLPLHYFREIFLLLYSTRRYMEAASLRDAIYLYAYNIEYKELLFAQLHNWKSTELLFICSRFPLMCNIITQPIFDYRNFYKRHTHFISRSLCASRPWRMLLWWLCHKVTIARIIYYLICFTLV